MATAIIQVFRLMGHLRFGFALATR